MINEQYIRDAITRYLYGIRPFLEQDEVTEIMINPGGRVFIEKQGSKIDCGQCISPASLEAALLAMRAYTRTDEVSPYVEFALDNNRYSGGFKAVSPQGEHLTIRRHLPFHRRPSLDDLVHRYHCLSEKQAKFLINAVIRQRLSCLFSGGTGSGKTTLMNALLQKLPQDERVIVIEDVRELALQIPNTFTLLANGIISTAQDAVKHCLRQSPDRIIIGETRGNETYDLVCALNTGHPGSVSSVHASSAKHTLSRMMALYQQSAPTHALTEMEIRRAIADAFQLIVYCEKNNQTHTRSVKEILLIEGLDASGHFITKPFF